jgi:hypothetical protein
MSQAGSLRFPELELDLTMNERSFIFACHVPTPA